ncbi:MAG TPA: alpha-glycosidase [Clostridiales bacterium]|nr:alpha-glycosidase [Clostridiales bacterium]
MNYSGIFHTATDNMCYALNDNELVINIKTDYDVDRIILHYGDPFATGIMGGKTTWNGSQVEINTFTRLAYQKLWSATVTPEFKRCRYFFEIISEDEVCYYLEDGIKSKKEFESYNGRFQYFFFPWINSADVNRVPQWVNQTIWYQIFPDRFYNSGTGEKSKNLKPWAGPHNVMRHLDNYGGDIQGITNKLGYLQDLGVTGLYLTPINESTSNHKYNTDDYYTIDKAFGTDETLKLMVKVAHKKGIRVMLDGVFNHCGNGLMQWQDVVKNGKSSPYFNWFIVNDWPFSTVHCNAKAGKYYTFAFSDYMPKLNTNNPEVIEYLLDVCTHWVKEYDIDALRLDVANEVSHYFCKELKKRMLSLKSDFYILGEVWHSSMPWLRGDEFDSVMNYPLQESINDFWAIPTQTRDEFERAINRCYSMYMTQTNDALFNMLDSHDTIRLITKLGSIDKFYQQMAVLFSMPGTVCIYYGTEVALEGNYDPDCRRCMPWKEIDSGIYNDQIKTMKALINLRKTHKSLRSSAYRFTPLTRNDRLLAYTKSDDNETIQIILNCSNADVPLQIDNSRILFSRLYSNETVSPNGVVISKI